MRTRIFPPCYSTDYAASTAAPWLSLFDTWHVDKGFCLTSRRTHINALRRVFETRGPVALETRFSDSDLVRLFKTRIRPKQFRAARCAFTQFLKERGQWTPERLRLRHSKLLDRYETYLFEMRGLA